MFVRFESSSIKINWRKIIELGEMNKLKIQIELLNALERALELRSPFLRFILKNSPLLLDKLIIFFSLITYFDSQCGVRRLLWIYKRESQKCLYEKLELTPPFVCCLILEIKIQCQNDLSFNKKRAHDYKKPQPCWSFGELLP